MGFRNGNQGSDGGNGSTAFQVSFSRRAAETGEEAGFLTNGSSPGFSPSPLSMQRVAGILKLPGRRSRLSDYSGGTAWDSHPLPFYPA